MFEAAAIASAVALWVVLLARVVSAIEWTAPLGVALALAAGGGIVVADFLSGLVHFTCDRFFSERTALIGPTFIGPFREHHVDPESIARHGLCERSGNNCIVLLPCLVASLLALPPGPLTPAAALAYAMLVALLPATAVTNEIHAWAHGRRAPALVVRMQEAGVLLSPSAHRVHHEHEDHARAYCITTGWLNRPLDACGFWTALERFLVRRGFPRGRPVREAYASDGAFGRTG